jgi:hypothetical protein
VIGAAPADEFTKFFGVAPHFPHAYPKSSWPYFTDLPFIESWGRFVQTYPCWGFQDPDENTQRRRSIIFGSGGVVRLGFARDRYLKAARGGLAVSLCSKMIRPDRRAFGAAALADLAF